jgi:hypothetical protein
VIGLVEFLRARLAEDEALAGEAPPGPWHIGNAVDPTQPCNVHTFPGARMVADGLNWLVAEHIARQNPARVLAEVEAKQQIIDAHKPSRPEYRPRREFVCETCSTAQAWDGEANEANCLTLRLLALPFASHPNYREEWKP